LKQGKGLIREELPRRLQVLLQPFSSFASSSDRDDLFQSTDLIGLIRGQWVHVTTCHVLSKMAFMGGAVPVLESSLAVPRFRPTSSDYPPIYCKFNLVTKKWEQCSADREGEQGVAMFSRFHVTLINISGAIGRSVAEEALAASQPAMSKLAQDLVHDSYTEGKASALSGIREFANFENFVLTYVIALCYAR